MEGMGGDPANPVTLAARSLVVWDAQP
jgi:hypothetical protein